MDIGSVPILSIIIFLPLLGAIVIAILPTHFARGWVRDVRSLPA